MFPPGHRVDDREVKAVGHLFLEVVLQIPYDFIFFSAVATAFLMGDFSKAQCVNVHFSFIVRPIVQFEMNRFPAGGVRVALARTLMRSA